MKNITVFTGLRASVLFACLSLAALYPQQAAAQDSQGSGLGASYITTNTDSTGAFVSRGVITIHADHTLSVIDSAQGGPTFMFSSQQGTWGFNKMGMLVGRTVDFDFPSVDVARVDYTFKFGSDGTISGTATLSTFPLINGNPNDGGGTLVAKFNFTGFRITLP
jgi:hypothetical protein